MRAYSHCCEFTSRDDDEEKNPRDYFCNATRGRSGREIIALSIRQRFYFRPSLQSRSLEKTPVFPDSREARTSVNLQATPPTAPPVAVLSGKKVINKIACSLARSRKREKMTFGLIEASRTRENVEKKRGGG